MKAVTICLIATLLVASAFSIIDTNFVVKSPILTLDKTVTLLGPDSAAYVKGVDTVLGVTGVGILDIGYKTAQALATLDAGSGLVAGAGGIAGADNNDLIAAGAAGIEAAGSEAGGLAGADLGPNGPLAGGAGAVDLLGIADGGIAVVGDNTGLNLDAVGNAADAVAGEVAAGSGV